MLEWGKLGARLRNIRGQEFPQLPERASHALQQPWKPPLSRVLEIESTVDARA
jgi:hypothetical protein